MRRRTRKLVKLNTPNIIDVAIANAIVRLAPNLISRFIPLPPAVQSVSGVGAGYLLGTFFNKPLIANASIASGVVDLAVPILEDVIGSNVGVPITQQLVSETNQTKGIPAVGDFMTLQDYIRDPSVSQSNFQYQTSY